MTHRLLIAPILTILLLLCTLMGSNSLSATALTSSNTLPSTSIEAKSKLPSSNNAIDKPTLSTEIESAVAPLAGNAFQTAGAQRERINNNGISSWQHNDTEFSVYINSPEAGTFTLSLQLISQESNSEISIRLGKTTRKLNLKATTNNQQDNANAGSASQTAGRGAGTSAQGVGAAGSGAGTTAQGVGASGRGAGASAREAGALTRIEAGSFTFQKGYNQLIFKGIKKDKTHFARISEIHIEGQSAGKLNFIRDNQNARYHFGRRGPSVHLGYQLPSDKQFKWFYNEITIPEGEDPIGSYFMANGFAEGYFGIQVNSPTERRILFSVWSPFHTDNPKEIPDDQKIILLKKGRDVNTGEFGNEGSGGQSFLRYNWKAGTTYRFLNSIEPDGKGNTTYTAYFFDPVSGDWRLIASFLRPKTDTWYKRPHSFLENFSPENGYIARRVFFQNQWARDNNGNWVELTRARFTGDDIANVEYRLDRDGGLDGHRFYLQNGGFINYPSKLNSMHERPSGGQQPTFDPENIARKLTGKNKIALSISDFAGWQRIEQRLISNDGNTVIYETKAQKGDGFLVIYNLANRRYDTIPHGYAAKISANSDYAVVKLRQPEDSTRKHKLAKTKKEDLPKEAIGVFTFANRHFQRIDSVKSFSIPDENSNWLTYLKEGPKKNKKATYSLIVWDPLNNKSIGFEQADTFAIAAKGSTIALITAADTLKMRSLVVIDPTQQRADTLFTDSVSIRQLSFDSSGQQLAFLASRDTAANKNFGLFYTTLTAGNGGKHTAEIQRRNTRGTSLSGEILIKGLPDKPILNNSKGEKAKSKTSAYNLRLIADTLTASLPAGRAPSSNGSVYFSEDGSKLFFGTAPKVKPQPVDTLTDDEKAKVDLWSHTDNILKPRQLKQEAQKKKQTYLAVYRISENKVLQLADSTVETIRLMHKNNGEIAIGTDRKPHERSITWSSRSLTDYYLTDLRTGISTTLLKGGQHLQLSPEGTFAIWWDPDQRQYYTREVVGGISRQVSSSLSVSLTDELHDTPDDPGPYGIAGWTDGDRHVIIYDRFDLWLIDPRGTAEPVNLTNGRAQQLRYRYMAVDTDKAGISAVEPILLSMVNEDSYDEGYATLNIASRTIVNRNGKEAGASQTPGLNTLIYGPFAVSNVIKAKNTNAVLWLRQTANRFPEVELSNLQFSETTVLSSTNNHQSEFNWPTVELVEWSTFAGDSLRGLLYKPENFDPAKKYPMIVYFYERSADTFHRYNYPQPSRSIISIPFYVSNEYIVFVPDITYTTGYPGKNAYDAIVSGVKSLLNTRSYINEKAMGLQGQSWGGYQIAYLITQTDMFAAAMAGAPVSNMISAYGGIRWGTGMSRMFQYENTQSRIGGTLWERPLLYLENSPLIHAPRVNTPLLMMHNDNDGAVPWYQGIEYFMALYRLGKPVWMLNYNGMDHNIEAKYWANRVDLSTRMFGFFNYYLKGKEKPEWMK